MQMQRMVVVAAVIEDQPGGATGVQHRRLGLRVGVAVQQPSLRAAVAHELRFDDDGDAIDDAVLRGV